MADLSLQDSSTDFDDSNLKPERYSPVRSRSRSPVNRSRSRSRSPGRGSHNDRDRRRPNITVTTKRIFVSNVPYEMKWQDLKDLFRKEVGEVAFVDMLETNDGKPKGSGIIEFKDKESARRALEKMHRYKVKDRALVVREEREKDRIQLQLQKMGGGGGGGHHNMGGGNMGGGNMGGNMGGGNMGGGNMMGGGMGNMGGNMGFNQQVIQQLGIEGPLTNSVFVSNLQYTVTWQKLKDVFKLAGNVLHAEVKKDKEGKSKGFGVVEFEHPMEAVQAISMFNNQELFGRLMRVRMDADSPDMRQKPIALPSGLKGIGMGLGAGGAPIQNIQQMQEMMPAMSNMGGGNMGGYTGNMGGYSGNMGNVGNVGMPMGNMGGGMGNMGTGMGNMGGGMGNMGTGMGNMGGAMGNMGNMNPSMGNTGMNMGGNTGMGGNMGNLGGQLGNLGGNLNTNMGMGMGDNLGATNYGTANMGMMGTGGGNLGNTGGGMGDFNSMAANNMVPVNQNMGVSNYNQNQASQNFGASNQMAGRNSNTIGTVSNRGRQEGCTIVAKNLPYACTWQTLRERFREVGDVKFAEIKMDKEGKSRGLGLVRFGSPDDAQRAVNLLNRTRIEDREIDVQLDRF